MIYKGKYWSDRFMKEIPKFWQNSKLKCLTWPKKDSFIRQIILCDAKTIPDVITSTKSGIYLNVLQAMQHRLHKILNNVIFFYWFRIDRKPLSLKYQNRKLVGIPIQFITPSTDPLLDKNNVQFKQSNTMSQNQRFLSNFHQISWN